jgi:hypothetical protein
VTRFKSQNKYLRSSFFGGTPPHSSLQTTRNMNSSSFSKTTKMNTSYLEQSGGHDFDSIEWQTASKDSISLGSIEEEAEMFRKSLGKKTRDKQDQVGKVSTFKYPSLSKPPFSMKSRSRTSPKIDRASKKKPGKKGVKPQSRTTSAIPMAAPRKADVIEIKPKGPSMRELQRIPSSIAFNDGCFEYLDELDTGTLKTTPASLQNRAVATLSGVNEEIPKASGKTNTKQPSRSTSDFSEFNKNFDFGDGLEIPEATEKAKKKKKSKKKKTRKEVDRDKRKSKRKDTTSVAFSEAWSDIKSSTRSAAKSESSKLKAKTRDQKKEEDHPTRKTKTVKSPSHPMVPKPREHPKRRVIEEGKEQSVRKSQSVPGNFSTTDTTSTAQSAFSSEFVEKTLNDGAPDLNRKKRSKRNKTRTVTKSSEFSLQWEEFTKKAAQENWTSATPRPADTKNKPVYRLRRRSSVRSIRAFKLKTPRAGKQSLPIYAEDPSSSQSEASS